MGGWLLVVKVANALIVSLVPSAFLTISHHSRLVHQPFILTESSFPLVVMGPLHLGAAASPFG